MSELLGIELLGIGITILLIQVGFVDWLDDRLARRARPAPVDADDELKESA